MAHPDPVVSSVVCFEPSVKMNVDDGSDVNKEGSVSVSVSTAKFRSRFRKGVATLSIEKGESPKIACWRSSADLE